MQASDVLSVAEVAAKYSAAGFTQSSLRWLLFNREQNGLSRAVIRVGRRLLIDERAFLDWLHSRRERAA